jgi:hypothetical protein
MVHSTNDNSRFLEDELWDFALEAIQDHALASTLMIRNGWADSNQKSVHRDLSDSEPIGDQIKQAALSLERFCRGKSAPTLERVLASISDWLPCAMPTVGYWLAENDLVKSANFTVAGVMEAADIFDIAIPFRAISLEHTKWLVDPDSDETTRINEGEKIAKLVLSAARRHGIIDPKQISSLETYLPLTEYRSWGRESVEACAELAIHDQKLIICRRPRTDAEIVRRLDRLLSFESAVPVEVALKQITRNGTKGVLPYEDGEGLQAFVTHCSYYAFDEGEIVSTRPLIVDDKISSLELPLILALINSPVAMSFEELELTARKAGISAANARLALQTSPLFVSVTENRFALLDPSMYDDLISDDDRVISGNGIADAPTGNRADNSGDLLDLAELGTTDEYWWEMYAGPIPLEQMNGALEEGQPYMVVLDPDTDRCAGLVYTARVRNKYYEGNPTVLLDDKGLKGRELQRFVSPNALRSAFAEDYVVFYNHEANMGQKTYGVVFRKDVSWN